MFPEICQIGPFTVYSYGLVFAVGIVVCAALMSREIRLAPKYAVEGLSVDMVYDLIFWVVLGGIAAYRLTFMYPDEFSSAGMFGSGVINGENEQVASWLASVPKKFPNLTGRFVLRTLRSSAIIPDSSASRNSS